MHLPENTLLHSGMYRIIRFIDSGGFGCTYEAEHIMLKKRIAVKEFFVKDFCNRDESTAHVTVGTTGKKVLVEKLRRKFIDEAKALSKLHHLGIVSVSDVFEENGTAYYVMDYIEGRSLSDIVKKEGPLPENRAVHYISQVAAALKYVHDNNRLHLDIKPGNIMIDGNDNPILIDFGASKQYDEENGENTSTLMGMTPGYAPPEQMNKKVAKFLPASDIYALGATLYKLLTDITPPDSIERAGGEPVIPLPTTISQPVRTAVDAAMRMNKKERPQSVSAFLSLLQDSPVLGKDEKTVIDEDDKQPLLSPPVKPLWERCKWIVIGIAVVIGAVAAFTLFHNHSVNSDIVEPAADSTAVASDSLAADSNPAVEATEQQEPVVPKVGTVRINSNVRGAKVFIGNRQGTTPFTFEAESGEYMVTVEAEGYITENRRVKIAAGKNSTENFKLQVVATETKPAEKKQKPVADRQQKSMADMFEMVYVKGGTFNMGSSASDSDAYDDAKPAHSVTLSGYYIGKYEVTQKQWVAVMGSNPSKFKGDNLPVENVTWDDIKEFIQKLNAKTGKNYRLPTEAEWEFAARGGNSSRGYRYSGSNNVSDVAWYDGNSDGKTHPVGTKKPNELGIFDMSGNVWEWCSDWYESNYYSNSPSSNPKGPSSGTLHTLRGGFWTWDTKLCLVWSRANCSIDFYSDGSGFRLAHSL